MKFLQPLRFKNNQCTSPRSGIIRIMVPSLLCLILLMIGHIATPDYILAQDTEAENKPIPPTSIQLDTTNLKEKIKHIDDIIDRGQMRVADSLITHYKNSDLEQVNYEQYLQMLTYEARLRLITGQFDKALSISSYALEEARSKFPDNHKLIINAVLWNAYTKGQRNNHKEAILMAEEYLNYLEQEGVTTPILVNPLRGVLALSYKSINGVEKSLEYEFTILESSTDDYNRAIVLNNIALSYNTMQEYKKAIPYLKQAIEINREIRNVRDQASNYINISNSLSGLDSLLEAQKYLHKSMRVARENNFMLALVRTMHNLGDVKNQLGQIDSAFYYLNRSYSLSEKMGMPQGIYYNTNSLGEVYESLGQYSQAKTNYVKAYDVIKESGNIELQAKALYSLYKIEEILNNYPKALDYFEEHSSLKDSMYNEEKAHAIALQEIKYETKQKEQENAYLNKELALTENYLNLQIILTIVSLIGLAITLGFIFMIRRKKQELEQANIEIISNQQEIEEKNESLAELNREKDELIRIIAHDLRNPINTFMGFISLLKEDPEIAKSTKMLEQIDNALNKSEQMVEDLVNLNYLEQKKIAPSEDPVDVSTLLSWCVNDLNVHANAKDIDIKSDISSDIKLATSANHLYRAVSNLLSNAVKYSPFGSSVSIDLSPTSENGAIIQISDQGPGFTEADREKMFNKFQRLSAKPTDDEQSTGLGLYIVKTICDGLDIEITCDTKVGEGTTFTLTLPAQPNSGVKSESTMSSVNSSLSSVEH